MNLEKLLQQPLDSLNVCLRERVYDAAAHADLIRDVMGLANLPGDGRRFIIFGIGMNAAGKQIIRGIDAAAFAAIDGYSDAIGRCLEPAPPAVAIGFNDDPLATLMTFAMPDVSRAPSQIAARKLQDQIAVVKAAGEANVADSMVARLVHAQQYGSEMPYDERGLNTLAENLNAVDHQYHDADRYYYREANALKLNFTLRNTGTQMLEQITVVLTMPLVESFAPVEKLCTAPGDRRSQHELDMLGYPAVTLFKTAAQIKVDIERLAPGAERRLFDCDLRVALRPEIAGKKVAVRYALHARGLREPQQGLLKLALRG